MQRSVPALGLVVCLALLGACGDDDGAGDGADERVGSDAVGGAAADSPAFALVRGRDTLLVERYTLSGNRVSGSMRDPTGSSVEYESLHSTSGGERSMRVVMRAADPSAPPIVTTFTMRGDSAHMRLQRGDSTIDQSDAAPANALPYLSPSMGMMALVVQSAREMMGDSGRVSLLAASVSQNPVVVQPRFFWRGDTAWVVADQMNQFRLIFENGELMSAENAPQQIRAVRLPAGAGASIARPRPAQGTGDTAAGGAAPPAVP